MPLTLFKTRAAISAPTAPLPLLLQILHRVNVHLARAAVVHAQPPWAPAQPDVDHGPAAAAARLRGRLDRPPLRKRRRRPAPLRVVRAARRTSSPTCGSGPPTASPPCIPGSSPRPSARGRLGDRTSASCPAISASCDLTSASWVNKRRQRSLEELPARLARLLDPLELGLYLPSQAGGDYLRAVFAHRLDQSESQLGRDERLPGDVAPAQERGDGVGASRLGADLLPLHLLQERGLVVSRRTSPEVLLYHDRLHVDSVALPERGGNDRGHFAGPPLYQISSTRVPVLWSPPSSNSCAPTETSTVLTCRTASSPKQERNRRTIRSNTLLSSGASGLLARLARRVDCGVSGVDSRPLGRGGDAPCETTSHEARVSRNRRYPREEPLIIEPRQPLAPRPRVRDHRTEVKPLGDLQGLARRVAEQPVGLLLEVC